MTTKPTAPLLPIVHNNGTSRKDLVDLRILACNALRAALDRLHGMAPHGRDYYPVPGLLEKATAQQKRRLDAVRDVLKEIEAEALMLTFDETRKD